MVTMELLPHETIETGSAPDAAVVWLHGLGADGHDFAPIVPELKLPTELAVRFIFPHAPMQPVTINNGYVMRAWYDIVGTDITAKQDREGILKAGQLLAAFADAQIANGISPERIVLAGFSQGGAIALHTGLRYPKRLGGVLALSTYLPLAESLPAQASDANKNVPIMMAHGEHDPIVPYHAGLSSRDFLLQLGYSVDWSSYAMEHSVCMEEIAHIGEWLSKVLG
jgi:phospholipase/carboxylesterase